MRPTRYGARLGAFAFLSLCLAPSLRAQASPPPNHLEYVSLASGAHDNALPIEGVVWSDFVMLPQGTPWLRLHYHAVNLDKGSYLRITSVLDGETMTMRQEHMPQWNNTSCYFNGNGVFVELVAGPNTANNFVDIRQVMAGDANPSTPPPETICGTTDNRVPSSDARTGRIDPVGCTGWIINVPSGSNNKLHLSAGHCTGTGQVLQFAVPASSSNCGLVFPPPAKQFAIDSASDEFVDGGVGNDYWVFRCFPNPTTGLTTFQEQGAAFTLAGSLPANGTTLRNWGYGLDGSNVNSATGGNANCSCSAAAGTGTRNQTQQTHTGPLNGVVGTRLNYAIDTCGGNSGSPVVHNTTGAAIGIHTHGGCSTTAGSSNSGTSILHAALQASIGNVALPVVGNDACANAIQIAPGVNGPYSTVGASFAGPNFPCGGTTVGKLDTWFYFNTCTGSHTLTTCTPTRNFDTVIEVFGGNCGSLVSIACNDDTGGSCSFGSTLTLNLVAGTYFVRVAGYGGASGAFDLVLQRPEVYDAGPVITDPTAGSGGAPVSVLQGAAPFNNGIYGFGAGGVNSLADDFVTHGTFCVGAIELFPYQTGEASPSITGVFLEIYNGDPSTTGVPIAGSPGFATNLVTSPAYTVTNTMTGTYRVLDTALTGTTRNIQSVMVGLPDPLLLNSSGIPGGRYWLRMRFTGSGASGPFVPPITVENAPATGNALQFNGTAWVPAQDGTNGQGLPFKLHGTRLTNPGAFTNLGGGCSAAQLELRGAPHVGGVVHIEMVGHNPAAIPLILIGFSNPNSSYAPFCGCVQRTTLDVLHVGTTYTWQVPMVPAAVGFELYTQGDQVFGAGLACDIGIGFRFELTDGWQIRL
jgi:hypothetical protein